MYSNLMNRVVPVLVLLMSLVPLICEAQFEDITSQAGLRHNCATGAIMGGGAAFIDYNMDGWLDLVFVGGEAPDKLYKNNSDGTFEDVSDMLSRHNDQDISTGVLVGDINGNGCPDLLFTTWNDDGIDYILTNDCNGHFNLEDESTLYKQANAMGCTLYDFNQDGLLDIYISNYVEEARFDFDQEDEVIGFDHVPAANYLYINQGQMIFTEESEAYGIESGGCALAVTVLPSPDKSSRGLYVANDFGEWVHPNEFFEIGKDLPYTDRAEEYGMDLDIYSMGIAIGDYDNDLNFDLYVTNLGANALLKNNGTRYNEIAEEMRVENTLAPDGLFATSWGTFFFDIQNDGWQDLFVANGFINSPDFIKTSFIDPNQLYINQNGTALLDRTEAFGIDNTGINRGAIYGDVDNDGDIDVLTAYINFEVSDNPDRHYKLYQNNTVNNNYLDVDLVATSTASDAFGSIVEISVDGQKSIAYKYSGGTHSSQNSPLVHIGIDQAESVDSIEIFWPSLETTSIVRDIPANTRLQIVEGTPGYEILGCTDQASDNYNPNATINSGCLQRATSTKELEKGDGGYTVSYNGSELQITSDSPTDYSYILSDISGRTILTSEVTNSNNLKIRVPAPSGIYFLSILTEENLYTLPVLISSN